MNIVFVMGTYRKSGAGARYVDRMLDAIRSTPGVETDIIWLGDYGLQLCRGCKTCYERGEAACPLKDGYLDAMRRLNEADAAVFYSPTFTVSITGLMKTFFDRSSYVLHRPYFHGRHAIVLTAAASWGEKSALRTLREIVSMMGFNIAGAEALCNARYERGSHYRARVDRRLQARSERLVRLTQKGAPIRPSVMKLIAFNAQKKSFGTDTPGCTSDKQYWKAAGWTDRDARFYCRANIFPPKEWVAKAVAFGLRKTGLLSM